MNTSSKLLSILLIGASVVCSSCEREDDNTNNGADATVSEGWVDLGLPSGLLWAEQNLSYHFNQDCSYIQWGETWQNMTTASSNGQTYTWSEYYYGTASSSNGNTVYTLYKYNDMSAFGTVDNLTTLQPSDDFATECLGSSVHIPTAAEWNELISNTTGVWWRNDSGGWGWKFTATNGNSIFLPAWGYAVSERNSWGWSTAYQNEPIAGYYWTSSLGTNGPCYAKCFTFNKDGASIDRMERICGLPIRPVRSR